jgi:hypothetical protein
MNTDATQFLDQSARRFRRRVGLLLLTIACGIVGLLYVREWLRSRGPAYGSVAMLLHNELADWSPGSCAVFDEKGRIIFAYATTIPRPVVELHDKDHRAWTDGLSEILEKGSASEARKAAGWAYWLLGSALEGDTPTSAGYSRAGVVERLQHYKIGERRARSPWEDRCIVPGSEENVLLGTFKTSSSGIHKTSP